MSNRRGDDYSRHDRDRSPRRERHKDRNHSRHEKSKRYFTSEPQLKLLSKVTNLIFSSARKEKDIQRGIEQAKSHLQSSLSAAISSHSTGANTSSSSDAYPRRITGASVDPSIHKCTVYLITLKR